MGDTTTRPDIVRRLNAMAGGIGGATALVSLDADELLERARTATGLDDLGEPTWEEPYRRLVAALEEEAELNVVGRLMCRHDLIRHLCARLQVLAAHRADPAVGDRAVAAPIFITGPARSGTSILQELLALDPGLRGPLAYEMAHPVPPPGVDDATRIAWAESEFDLWGDVHPPFRAVHDLDARLPEECLWLMAPEFDTGFWATNVDVPSWMAYRAFTDPTPTYAFHRRFVQVLQADDERTWVFKSPMHVSRLATLLAVYPDARIVRTHRDPARTLPSMASTLVNGRLTRSDAVDPIATATSARFGLAMMLNGLADDRAVPAGQVTEVQYLDLLDDPVATIGRAFEELGVPMSPELPDLVRDYLGRKPQNRFGVHRYTLSDYGFDAAEVRAELAPYIDAFDVPLEG